MHFVPESIEVTTRGGLQVLLREVNRSDEKRALAAFDQLSVDTIYQRFWSNLVTLNRSMVERLVVADQVDHIAWCAMNPSDPDGIGYGAASLWRCGRGSSGAEISFTVLDASQGKGLGTVLMGLLWVLARRLDIEFLRANVLSSNRGAVRWFLDLGGRLTDRGEFCEIDFFLGEESSGAGAKREELEGWIQFFEKEF